MAFGSGFTLDTLMMGNNVTLFADAIARCRKIRLEVQDELDILKNAHQGESGENYQTSMNQWTAGYEKVIAALEFMNERLDGGKNLYIQGEGINTEISQSLMGKNSSFA
jgi:uncharacterized protein YukE